MKLRKLQAITQGFKNFIFKSEYHEAIAFERAKICTKCPQFNKDYKFKKWMPEDNSITPISGAGCQICGCYIPAKVRQLLEGCPEKKW